MQRRVALFLTVLMISQIASYSFEEIPPQIEWEDHMKGDPDWEVSGRNNNSSTNNTGCGYEWNYTTVYDSPNGYTFTTGQDYKVYILSLIHI